MTTIGQLMTQLGRLAGVMPTGLDTRVVVWARGVTDPLEVCEVGEVVKGFEKKLGGGPVVVVSVDGRGSIDDFLSGATVGGSTAHEAATCGNRVTAGETAINNEQKETTRHERLHCD